MPSSRFETRAGWIAGRHAELIDAIQGALVEGIRIPPEDRCVRVLEYPEHAMAVPPGRGARYSVLEITLFKGRSLEAKRRLYAALAAALAGFEVLASDLKVVLVETERENWSVNGVALSDVDIGFRIDV